MRRKLLVLAVIFQVAVLAFMAAKREYIARTGEVVYLRTAPVDPRDLFRGDFVRLDYDISAIPARLMKGTLTEAINRENFTVYAVLQKEENGLAGLLYATDEKPADGLYLKARIPKRRWSRTSKKSIHVKYGIESYYVQQGKGLELEKKRGRRTDVQVPMEMEVAIGSDGTGVIKGYRWCPLGIGLEITRRPARNRQEGPRSASVRLTLQNASDRPLALVDLPDSCSFSLEPVIQADKYLYPETDFCKNLIPEESNQVILQPLEKFQKDFDFTSDRWQVRDGDKKEEIGTLGWSQRFRIVYRPPVREKCAALSAGEIIWHGHLASRAFHGGGNID